MIKKLLLISTILCTMSSYAYGATISWSKTFADGQVLAASDLETLKTNITDVVNAGGGPATLTANQTLSGDNTYSGTSTFSGAISATGNTTLGNAVTDNITLTGAIQGTSALYFDGVTDNTIETIFSIVDPTTTDKTVTFGNTDLDFREQVIKGWIQYDQAGGTATIADGFNATVTDGATGTATVNWGTDFADANYAVTCSSPEGQIRLTTLGAATLVVTTENSSGVAADINDVCCIGIGDQ